MRSWRSSWAACETWGEFETQLRTSGAAQAWKKEALETGAKNKMLDELIGQATTSLFPSRSCSSRSMPGWSADCARWRKQGMTARTTCARLDFGRLRAAQRDEAEREVRASLVVDRIADAENVTVSDEELDKELLMLSIQAREPYEALRERLQKDGGLARLREEMRREKTGDVLYEKLAS